MKGKKRLVEILRHPGFIYHTVGNVRKLADAILKEFAPKEEIVKELAQLVEKSIFKEKLIPLKDAPKYCEIKTKIQHANVSMQYIKLKPEYE